MVEDKKIEEMKKEEVKTNVKAEAKAEQPKKPFRPDPHEMVEVISNVKGKLVYVSPNNVKYTWDKTGKSQYMTVQQLMEMHSSKSKFFDQQWVKIEDEDMCKYLRIDHYYANELSDEHIEEYLLNGSERSLKDLLDRSNRTEKIRIVASARELVESGKLTDYRVIDFIENQFGTVLKAVK